MPTDDVAVPLVLLVDELTAELAAAAHRIGARVCLRAHGTAPLRLAILRAARDRTQERARALVASSVSDVLFALRVEGDHYRFLRVNDAFTRATGLAEEQVVGKLVEEVIPEPSRSLVLQRYHDAIAERRTIRWDESTEYPIGRRQGEVSVTPIIEADGRITTLIGAVHDVTDDRARDETIRMYTDLVRTVGLGLMVWGRDGGLAAFNAAAEQIAGAPLAAQQTMAAIFPGARGEALRALCDDVARDGIARDRIFERTAADPRILAGKVFGLPGRRIGVCLEDITARASAVRVESAERRALELLADGAPLPQLLAVIVSVIDDVAPPGTAATLLLVDEREVDDLVAAASSAGAWSCAIEGDEGRVLGLFVLRGPAPPDAALQAVIARLTHVAAIAIGRRQLDDEFRALSARIEAVREEERTGIAREIHDELGQALTALKMDVAWIGRRLHDPLAIAGKLGEMSTATDAVIHAVRRISAELRPGILDDLGLAAAIEWQVEEFAHRTGIACDVEADLGENRPDRTLTTAAFRIFQEALTNVARHASASRVRVHVGVDEGRLELEIADDGVGVAERAPRGLGLLGMRERARRLGGDLEIRRIEPRGTSVRASMPL